MGRRAGSEAPSKYHLAYIKWPGGQIVSTMDLTPMIGEKDGQPVYETCIFYEGADWHGMTFRYHTPEDALACHRQWTERVSQRLRFDPSTIMGGP